MQSLTNTQDAITAEDQRMVFDAIVLSIAEDCIKAKHCSDADADELLGFVEAGDTEKVYDNHMVQQFIDELADPAGYLTDMLQEIEGN